MPKRLLTVHLNKTIVVACILTQSKPTVYPSPRNMASQEKKSVRWPSPEREKTVFEFDVVPELKIGDARKASLLGEGPKKLVDGCAWVGGKLGAGLDRKTMSQRPRLVRAASEPFERRRAP